MSRFIILLVIKPDPPIDPPTHPPMGRGVSTNHKSSNRIELSQSGQDLFNCYVTGQQPLKLAHSPLGYAVGKLILIGLDGQSLGSKHTEINFNKIYFPRKQLKIHYHFLTICL